MAVTLTAASALWFVAAAFAAVVTTEIPTEDILRWVQTCNKTYPVSQEMLRSLASTGGLLSDESDVNSRCYLECYERLGGTVNSDGKVNVEKAVTVMVSYYPKVAELGVDTVTEILKNCNSKSGTGQCMTSYLIRNCFIEGLNAKSPHTSVFDTSSYYI
uniref:Odorant-binding protein 17 n=1 Tax=Oedaleus infernalis TaxID=267432 RepID=A0A385I8C7_9ORTH|nr:odorant-binding protein 17 [Oedaleus infernalis]